MALLTTLVIEDYQALGTASFRLGRFTVITGPTGSGKSAVIRALRLVAFNQRGSAYIRHGRRSCQVVLQDDCGLGVVIARGKGQDAYVVDVLGQQKTFTKLGGTTPEEVSGLLALAELNFTGQFDRPYLLDESGGAIARILGRLTNVDLVFEAARAGYARKLGIAGDLRRAQGTVEALTAQVQQYTGLPAQRAACTRAEASLASAQAAAARLATATELVQAAIEAHKAVHAAQEGVQAVQPPALGTLDALETKRARLDGLVRELASATAEIRVHQTEIQGWSELEQLAHKGIHDSLVKAGKCPTCGQQVTA